MLSPGALPNSGGRAASWIEIGETVRVPSTIDTGRDDALETPRVLEVAMTRRRAAAPASEGARP